MLERYHDARVERVRGGAQEELDPVVCGRHVEVVVDRDRSQGVNHGGHLREVQEVDSRMADDWELADYGIKDMAKDAYEAFIKDERGSFSLDGLTPEKIQALHRMWQKAKDMGREFGEYIKAAIPELSEADVKKVQEFADSHFVQRRPFETPEGEGTTLKTIKARRQRKVLGRVVTYPEYYKKYLDGWNPLFI